jgi:hypothetical protein
MKVTVEPGESKAFDMTGLESKGTGFGNARLSREWRTMMAMVCIYCRAHHHPDDGLCADCEQFLSYANTRLERCRFGAEKPTCAKCPVHCYQRERREQVRVIMRHAGPRMIWEHPVMSLRHWIDGLRKAPKH